MNTLAGAPPFTLGSQQASNIFDPAISVSQLGLGRRVRTHDPDSIIGGGLNFNRTWSDYHFSTIYNGGETVHLGTVRQLPFGKNSPHYQFHGSSIIMEGNRGHRRIIANDVEPIPGTPEMPDGLSRLAKREFRFMCRALLDLVALTLVDGRALADYCEAFAQKQKALKELNRLGAAIETYGINKDGERVFLGIKKNSW